MQCGRNSIWWRMRSTADLPEWSANSLYAVTPGTAAPGQGSLLGYGGAYGSALSQLFRRDYPTYSIGLNLTLPLRNRQARIGSGARSAAVAPDAGSQ